MFDRGVRIIATGFCFFLFGLGGLLILVFVFPLLRLFVGGTALRQRYARRLIHYSFRFFARTMVFCGTITYEVRNAEKLARSGLLIVANHPSLIDVVLLISFVRQPNCVVKSSLRDNLFTRGPVRIAGFVVNADGPQLIGDCIASVHSGDSLVIFPEGTRSREHNGTLNALQRGAANIALRGGLALTPVVITVSEPMLSKGQRWYHAPRHRPHFVLSVEDDIASAPYRLGLRTESSTGGKLGMKEKTGEKEVATALAARRLSEDLDAFFVRKIKQQCSN